MIYYVQNSLFSIGSITVEKLEKPELSEKLEQPVDFNDIRKETCHGL